MTNLKEQTKKVVGYSDDDIDSLDPMTHIRLRYGMYMGADPSNHMINELLDNVIDEHMNGFGTMCLIKLDLNTNTLTVQDFGRGIPVGVNSKTKKPSIQMVFHDANTGGKFGQSDAFKNGSAGLNGTGLKGVTALSELVHAESERDGKRVCIEFSCGKIITPYHEIPALGYNGTLVTIRPDSRLLSDHDKYLLDKDKLIQTCKMRAFLNKGFLFDLSIINKENKLEKFNFKYDNGILDYMDEIVKTRIFNMDPIIFEANLQGQKVSGPNNEVKPYTNRYEICFLYDAGSVTENILSFANGIRNDRGTHESGFKFALTNIVNKFISENDLLPKKYKNIKITGEDIRKGLVCIINAKVTDCIFTGQTKNELGNPEVRADIITLMNQFMDEYIQNNKVLFTKICKRIVQFAISSEEAKKAQDKIVKLSLSSAGLSLSNKFVDCVSDDPDTCELFICEGKSASGSLRRGRDGNYQAIYALKGKPINAFGSKHSALISNKETNEIMQILFGTNNKSDIDYDKINYKKIIIIADSDDDGLHITSLMMMLFKEHFEELVKRGYIYVACPPKYRITVRDKDIYFKNDYEFDSYKAEYVSNRYSVKGLNMLDIIQLSEEFRLKFNLLKNKYALPDDILSMVLSEDNLLTVAEHLDEEGIDVTEIRDNEFYAQGLLEYDWLDVELNNELQKEVKSLINIFNTSKFELTDKKENEIYECDIIDGLNLIDKEFKFSRYRFKGLTTNWPLSF